MRWDMRRVIALGIIAVCLFGYLALALSTAGRGDAAPRRAGTGQEQLVLIGDSTSWRAEDKILAMHPDWKIDGVQGRNVTELVPRIRAHLAVEGVAPRTLVIALGTNGDPGWTKADYVYATELVPASTRIVFVTPFRDAAVYGQASYERMRQYAYWMRTIADDRPRTAVSRWRQYAEAHPERLVDGVHEDDPLGEQAWADCLDAAYSELWP